MNKIIAYVSPGFSEAETQKIAEMLRIRQIEITTLAENATLIICVPKDVPGFGMTLEKCAETIVEKYHQEIIKFTQEIITFTAQPHIDIPDIQNPRQNKYPHFVAQRAMKRYNQTKQKLFNRTQCK